jgi:hypothetical protein
MGATSEPIRRAALHAAFHLVEAVQLPEVGPARIAIVAALADAEHSGWPETIATLLFAKAVDAVTNVPDEAGAATERLIERAEGLGQMGMLAAGLALRAALALRDGDVVRHLADTSRAVVLLDVEGEPLARGSGFIAAGTAYEALSLWELGDELHSRAEALVPLCDDKLLSPVIAINRGLTWFWWTAALLEVGEYEKAEELLRDRTEDLLVDLPASWALELRISRLAGLILMGAADAGAVVELRELGDRLNANECGPNWLPRMLVCLGLAHDAIHTGNFVLATAYADAARELARVHGTVYQRSFARRIGHPGLCGGPGQAAVGRADRSAGVGPRTDRRRAPARPARGPRTAHDGGPVDGARQPPGARSTSQPRTRQPRRERHCRHGHRRCRPLQEGQ